MKRNAVMLTLAAIVFASGIGQSNASTVSQREYRRGYNDCSQGRYDQFQHGASYRAGCRAAEDQMNSSGSSCPPGVSQADHYKYPGCNTVRPGRPVKPGRPVNISDLRGRDSIKVYDIMIARGFKSVDSITTGETLYGIYYNPVTRQCVQVTNANNRVADARDIFTHPKCR